MAVDEIEPFDEGRSNQSVILLNQIKLDAFISSVDNGVFQNTCNMIAQNCFDFFYMFEMSMYIIVVLLISWFFNALIYLSVAKFVEVVLIANAEKFRLHMFLMGICERSWLFSI